MPLWTEIVESIATETTALGEVFEKGAAEVAKSDARGASMAGRLRVAKDVARELAPIAGRLTALANGYVTQMYEIDAGTRALIESAAEPGTTASAEGRAVVCGYFTSLRDFQRNIAGGVGAARMMAANMESLERTSRDLRGPLREVRHALTMLGEAEDVAAGWVSLIEQSPVDCAPS